MKKVLTLVMIFLFLFIVSGYADTTTTLDGDKIKALFSFILPEGQESTMSTQSEAEIASTIPRVGGNWNSTGAGTIGGQRVSFRGTASVTSRIEPDGYEAVTRISQEAQAFDANGRYIDTIRTVSEGYIKITSRRFFIEEGGIRETYTIESDTLVNVRRVGLYDGVPVDVTWNFTRGGSGGGSSGGGGCSTGSATPFAALLILPLFLAYRRK